MEYIQNIITTLKNYLTPQENNDTLNQYEKFSEILKKINENIYNLIEYENLYSTKTTDFINLINALKYLKNTSITLTDEQVKKIKETKTFEHFISNINNKIEALNKILSDIAEKKAKNKSIEDLINKLNSLNNKLINENMINEIFDLIKEISISEEDIFKITDNIFKYNTTIYENSKTEIPSLTEEEVSEIFKKYGYDFNKVDEDLKQKILITGNLQNIDEVFSTIIKYKIPFNEKNNENIYLLIKASKESIETIYELSQKYSFSLTEMLKIMPSIFLYKTYERTRMFEGEKSKQAFSMPGSFEDFCENISLIESLGYNITISMQKNKSIFIQPSRTLKTNIEALRKYGFPENLAEAGFKLSGLASANIIETIEKFIELDELKYLQENTSRLLLGNDSYIFTRIYAVKRLNKKKPTEQIEYKKTQKVPGKDTTKEVLLKKIWKEDNNEIESLIDTEIGRDNLTNYIFDKETDEMINQRLKTTETIDFSQDLNTDSLIENIERNFKQNNLTYIFDGIIISRFKTLRIYSTLLKEFPNFEKEKLLLFALTYNSILHKDEFNNIIKKVQESNKVKKI